MMCHRGDTLRTPTWIFGEFYCLTSYRIFDFIFGGYETKGSYTSGSISSRPHSIN